MARRWIGLSVAALCLGGASTAWAQPVPGQPPAGMVAPQGAGLPASAEPMAFPSSYGIPMAAPGGMPGGGAPDASCPQGAPMLPPGLPSAWNDSCPGRCALYFDIGGMALQHERPGHLPLALQDPGNLDTGNPIPRRAPELQDLHSLNLDFAGGPRVTMGYHWDWGDVEVSGFYLPRNTSAIQNSQVGKIDALFFNPPLGFEGDNGMWLQADVLRTSLRTELGSAEATLNCWNQGFGNIEFGGGVRYVDEVERLSIYTGDDDLTVLDINGNPDPRREATYLVRTHNRIVGPQLNFQMTGCLCPWLNIVLGAKACAGVNFLDSKVQLQRGDGFIGFSNEREHTQFSHLYETGLYLDFCFCEGFHVRTGYQTLWLVNVAVAQDQVDYDLRNTLGRIKDDGSIFYHGPMLEFQFFF